SLFFSSQVGAYRFLLLSFAVVDIIISTVHFILVPGIIMTEFGFIFFGFRYMESSTAIGVWADLIFIGLFYQTFVLLAFHYIYRYILLCNPSWLRWVGRNNPWRNWICLALLVDVLYIGGFMLAIKFGFLPTDETRNAYIPIMKDAYNIDLSSSYQPGFMGIVYWTSDDDGTVNWSIHALISSLLIVIIITIAGFVIVMCIWRVMSAMKRSDSLADRTRTMQHQLFRALLIQTIVPTLTSYIPLGMVFIVPLTRISLGGWGSVFMMSTALFPLIDPFLVLFLVSG
ncbi:hypothetical protein PFISCL1PPCAC_2081, partial [Pristionchus fissidentatus]